MSSERERGRVAEARRNDQALLAAARRLVARDGPGASVADIAQEAGIGIASLYRRYATKEELLAQLCVTSMAEFAVVAKAALEADDAGDGLRVLVEDAVHRRSGVFEAAADGIQVTPAMRTAARENFALLEAVVERAKAAGAVAEDVGAADVRQLIFLFSRRQEDHGHERILALAMRGWVEQAPALPGRAPTWDDLVRRWQ